MATQKIYVGRRDAPLWDAARRVAERREISLSRLVTDALIDYIPRVIDQPLPEDRWADIAADAA